MPISKDDIPFGEIDFSEIPATRSELETWIEKHGDKLNDIRELWLDLDVKVLSTVENPSHDSNVVRTKEDGSKVREVTALKSTREKAEEKQIIEAPAMVANEKDKDGDVPPGFVVEEAAHNFLKTERVDSVDSDHETPLNAERSLTDRGTVVESWILEDEKEFETVDGETKTYGNGDWMVAIELEDETWERFEKGELTGLSIMGVPEKKVEFKSSDPIQSEEDQDNMEEESEIKMPDVDEIRSELEQYNVDTSGMNDEDLMEFAEALHSDLMEDLTDEEGMHGDDEDDEEDEMDEDSAHEDKDEEQETEEESEEVEEQTEEESECECQKEEPCWDGYEMVGMKPNPDGDGMVPNCVPADEASEDEKEIGVDDICELISVELSEEEQKEVVSVFTETEEQNEEEAEEESEEKNLEDAAEMMSEVVPDLSKDEAMTMLERMDGDDDTADEDSMDEEETEDEKEEQETEREEKSAEWQEDDAEEVEKDDLPAWLKEDIDRDISVKEQETETEKEENDNLPDWMN